VLTQRNSAPASASAISAIEVGSERQQENLWPELFAWVNSTGMDTSDIAVEVTPVTLGPGELGVVAKTRLEPGDILAWAPKSVLLTKDKAVALWGDDVAELPDRVAIATLLIHERLVRGSQSEWSTYWKTLPAFNGDCVGPSFLWTTEELEWLDGSDGYTASVQMHDTLLDEFESLQSSLFNQRPDDFPSSAFTVENYLWAAAVVASRAYGDDSDGTNLAIAPLVDFLNHKAGALQLTRFSNGIVAYAHKHYEAGEQVWVNYGVKSNAELVSQYGFIDDDNQDEAIFLRVGSHLQISEPHAAAKRALLQELLGEGSDPDSAILKVARRTRDWESQLLPTVRCLALGADDVVPVTIRELVPTQHPRLEAAAWALLEEALQRRASDYPASLEKDRRSLEAGGLPERHAVGLRLRISEQELIYVSETHASQKREVSLADLVHLQSSDAKA